MWQANHTHVSIGHCASPWCHLQSWGRMESNYGVPQMPKTEGIEAFWALYSDRTAKEIQVQYILRGFKRHLPSHGLACESGGSNMLCGYFHWTAKNSGRNNSCIQLLWETLPSALASWVWPALWSASNLDIGEQVLASLSRDRSYYPLKHDFIKRLLEEWLLQLQPAMSWGNGFTCLELKGRPHTPIPPPQKKWTF